MRRGWSRRTEAPALASGEIHVWRCTVPPSDGVMGSLVETLDQAEVARARRFRLPADRRRYVTARAALRSLAASYGGTSPGELRFAAGAGGKPFVIAPALARGLRFNLSHSGDEVLLAFARGLEVGVDLECLARDVRWQGIAGRYFPGDEEELLRSLPAASRRREFLALWCCKEALGKARGDGVLRALAFGGIPIPAGPGPIVLPGLEASDVDWVIHPLRPRGGYVGALAYPAPEAKVSLLSRAT